MFGDSILLDQSNTNENESAEYPEIGSPTRERSNSNTNSSSPSNRGLMRGFSAGSLPSLTSERLLQMPSLIKLSSASPNQIQDLYTKITHLEQSIQQRDLMLMSASHECRNPLNGIHSNLELSENMLNGKNPTQDLPKLRSLIHNARICGEVLLQYINNILDAGKLEVDDIDINHSVTNVKQLLEKVWAICSESIRRKNLLGQLTLQDNVPSYLMLDA